MGLLAQSGKDFVEDVQILVFAPYKAYELQIQGWTKAVDDYLSNRIFKSQIAASAPPALIEVVNAINVGIRGRALPPAPILEEYDTDDAYTLQKQTDSNVGGGVKAGINVPGILGGAVAANLSANASAAAKESDSSTETHKVTAKIRTADFPVNDPNDVLEPAAMLWLQAKVGVAIQVPTEKAA